MDFLFLEITTQTSDLLEQISRVLFGALCHQQEGALLITGERSLWLCPRCFGLHLGFFAIMAFGMFLVRRNVRMSGWSLSMAVLLGSVTGIHWVLTAAGMCETGLFARMITGTMSGIGGAFLFLEYRVRRFDHYSRGHTCSAQRRLLMICPMILALSILLFIIQDFLLLTSIAILSVSGNILVIGWTIASVIRQHIPRFPQHNPGASS